MEESQKETVAQLFWNVVKAELELHNFLYPGSQLTVEDVIAHLEKKKLKELPST